MDWPGFHTGFLGVGGRSLWGTTTVSCMSIRLYKFGFEYEIMLSFLGGGEVPLYTEGSRVSYN